MEKEPWDRWKKPQVPLANSNGFFCFSQKKYPPIASSPLYFFSAAFFKKRNTPSCLFLGRIFFRPGAKQAFPELKCLPGKSIFENILCPQVRNSRPPLFFKIIIKPRARHFQRGSRKAFIYVPPASSIPRFDGRQFLFHQHPLPPHFPF